jgi:hypothetical protein
MNFTGLGNTPKQQRPLNIKARLALLGKKQTDLFEELNRIGGEYTVSSTGYLSDIINGRASNGRKAQTIKDKSLQILNLWEMEMNTHGKTF